MMRTDIEEYIKNIFKKVIFMKYFYSFVIFPVNYKVRIVGLMPVLTSFFILQIGIHTIYALINFFYKKKVIDIVDSAVESFEVGL